MCASLKMLGNFIFKVTFIIKKNLKTINDLIQLARDLLRIGKTLFLSTVIKFSSRVEVFAFFSVKAFLLCSVNQYSWNFYIFVRVRCSCVSWQLLPVTVSVGNFYQLLCLLATFTSSCVCWQFHQLPGTVFHQSCVCRQVLPVAVYAGWFYQLLYFTRYFYKLLCLFCCFWLVTVSAGIFTGYIGYLIWCVNNQ